MEYAKVQKSKERVSQEEEEPTDEYDDALVENEVAKVSICNKGLGYNYNCYIKTSDSICLNVNACICVIPYACMYILYVSIMFGTLQWIAIRTSPGKASYIYQTQVTVNDETFEGENFHGFTINHKNFPHRISLHKSCLCSYLATTAKEFSLHS